MIMQAVCTLRSKGTLSLAVFTAIGLVLLAASHAQAQQWLISDQSNNLWDYTQGSGAAVNARAISPIVTAGAITAGIDFSPTNGQLYALTTLYDNSLYTVNPTTGAASLVGPTGQTSVIEGDLAFDPTTGTLYGAYEVPSGTSNEELFTLNTSTGVATIVGPMSSSTIDVSGLAFDSSGQLWAVASGVNSTGIPALLELDKTTGAITSSMSMGLDLNQPTLGIRFDPSNGQLYMADGDGNFYQINTSNGDTTLIDSTGVDATGLAFVSNVPEPGSIGVLAAGSMVLLGGRKRR
jgi:DNA-binding beta-propeller fold protein YncE